MRNSSWLNKSMKKSASDSKIPVQLMRLQNTLDRSRPGTSKLFDQQRATVAEVNTRTKRLEAMNKYVWDQEGKRGKQELQAAKTAAKSTKPVVKEYPGMQDILELGGHPVGERRLSPSMAVMVPLPYELSEAALFHGASRGSGMSKNLKAATA